MKRTVPLIITALGGFVLIIAFFIPETEGWGEVAALWFDILASIAFILGGGNLLRIHLQKISDQAAGWAYSAVVLAAFFVTLAVGLFKIGSPPAAQQEYYGWTFAELTVNQWPGPELTFQIEGQLPDKAGDEKPPLSVRRQIDEQDGNIVFRGWMRGSQKSDLIEFEDELKWRSDVEKLYDEAQPPEPLQGKVRSYADHQALAFQGHMTEESRDRLLELGEGGAWQQAVEQLYERSQQQTSVSVASLPEELPADELPDDLSYDAEAETLTVTGPLTPQQQKNLLAVFPKVRPYDEQRRQELREEITSRGEPLTEEQLEVFRKNLDAVWTADRLVAALNRAGQPEEKQKTYTEMYQEYLAAEEADEVPVIAPTKTVGEETSLNDEQVAAVREFAADASMTVDALIEQLEEAGTFTDRQKSALRNFMDRVPTAARQLKDLAFQLHEENRLSDDQLDFLLEDYRREHDWRDTVATLYVRAHQAKYPWSGSYRAQGTPFWWLYEYVFKPLTATMFAMLAFYVASAAFRAFRAKNFEAFLLLATAFIILLGRTFAGVWITSWLPEWLEGLRIENMTVYIMSVFNTAGNRAIMIGVALGIASTSLKVLLGVDRSYLGTGED